MDEVRDHSRKLTSYAAKKLGELDKVDVYGPESRTSVASFNVEGIHPHDLSSIMDAEGIAIRGGHHCAMPLMRVLGLQGAARASFYVYNNLGEVDRLVSAVEKSEKNYEGLNENGCCGRSYREELLEHYRSPLNYGRIDNPSASFKDFNPVCGDEIEMFLLLSKGSVEQIKFEARGCAISRAAASFLTEHVKGREVSYAMEMSNDEMLGLLPIEVVDIRIKCALLALKCMKKAIVNHGGGVLDESA